MSRAICDLGGKNPFPVRSTLRQFQRYLDFWNRDEWQELATAAVAALSQRELRTMEVYLGPGGKQA